MDATPNARFRWSKLVLFISLAVNLLILGVVIGHLFLGPPDRPHEMKARDLGFGPFVQALPEKDHTALRSNARPF